MVKIFLYPLSWLYGVVVYFRNRFYDLNLLKSTEFDVPVISIGNITVGGTGKTPHIEYLVNLLKENFEVATLSRGYKRKTHGFRFVEINSTVADVGDEPLQIKKKFTDVTVAVCENRVAGVEKLLHPENKKIPEVILLDDAFQHRRITAGINILLIDYNRPIKEDTLLPAGRLREGKHQAERANVIIFTKCPREITPIARRIMQKEVGLKPYQELFFTTFAYEKIKPVFSDTDVSKDFYSKNEYAVLIVSGIASPTLIQNHLKKYSRKVTILPFPDHHNYSEKDIQTIMRNFGQLEGVKKLIVTTDKDVMRFNDMHNLPEEFKEALYFLPVEVMFLEEEEKIFNKKILAYVGKNKSNRKLHKREI